MLRTRLRGSLRARTTAAATVVVVLTLAAGAWALLLTLEDALERSHDQAARGRARDIVALARAGAVPTPVSALGDDSVAQVVDGRGRVVAASRDLVGRPAIGGFRAPGTAPVVRTVELRDGREVERFRVWAVSGDTGAGPVTAYVGTSLESVTETVATLRRLLLAGLPPVVLLLASTTWLVLGRALRPVEAIRSEVAGISDAGLDRRVPVPSGDDEIARLARTMNEMLARLEAGSARQRAFVADASHELQSPLTAFRTQLEVALARPGATDWTVLARELLQDSQAMERLVRDLLFLAREDERPGAGRPEGLVDLDDVVLEEAARLRVVSSVRFDTSAVSAAPVRGSREQLVRLVRNLLENAERHARSQVVVRLSAREGAVELRIADDGPGVPQAERPHIFERFVRLDAARARDSGGSGLGLAIVEAIARRHAGSVEITGGTPGATFVVRLPAPGGPA